MTKQIFTLYDKKGQIYTTPFFMLQIGEATRALDGIVNNQQTQVAQYPDDYALYKIGELDDHTGKLTPLDVPEFVAEASQYVRKEVKDE